MSMTLFEINSAIEVGIEALLDSVDPETGEVDAEKAAALDKLKEAQTEKLDNIGAYIKNLTAEANALAEEAQKLKERADAKKKQIDKLKDYVTNCMLSDGREKIETTRAAFSFRTSKAVEILDEQALPKKYLVKKVTFSPDKTAIKEAIKAGQKVRGASIIERMNLQIK